MTMEVIILLIIAMIFLLLSIKISTESERIVVFRFGRFFKIVGPGLILILPFIDKTIRVKLSDKIPGWKKMSKRAIGVKDKKIA